MPDRLTSIPLDPGAIEALNSVLAGSDLPVQLFEIALWFDDLYLLDKKLRPVSLEMLAKWRQRLRAAMDASVGPGGGSNFRDFAHVHGPCLADPGCGSRHAPAAQTRRRVKRKECAKSTLPATETILARKLPKSGHSSIAPVYTSGLYHYPQSGLNHWSGTVNQRRHRV